MRARAAPRPGSPRPAPARAAPLRAPGRADRRRIEQHARRRGAAGKLTSKRDSASRSTSRAMWPSSVASLRTNLRRAGTLKKRSRTSMRGARADAPPGRTGVAAPPSTADLAPLRRTGRRARRSRSRDTEPIEGSASPRKPSVRHRLEIIERGDLAGGVAGERQGQLVGGDAAAVVAHADQADAAALDVDLDAAGAGVQAVLDELLDDGGRALDHFAGGDLVDELVREARG